LTGGLADFGVLGIRRVLLNSGLPELVGSGAGALYSSPLGNGLSFKGVGELSVAKAAVKLIKNMAKYFSLMTSYSATFFAN
jgi:hypothetical protein